ncbi:DUF3885 domain-containing protein [Photobacterium chitinilyticum]|nr:DUF3885 domain-containing protein [Photobacterium chitinilyticum]
MNSIKLEKPMYYKNDFALRFELGPAELGVWANREEGVLNDNYFKIAQERALSIFHSAFSPSDDISIYYQIFSDGRKKIRKGNYFLKQLKSVTAKKVEFSDHRDIYREDLDYKSHCWKRVSISNITINDLNVVSILEPSINTDFGGRSPSVSGECYIKNHTQGLVFHIYDDRGMDLVANEKEALQGIYCAHYNWLLKYDLEHMDSVFS